MKNILKKSIFALLLISLGSCTEKDIDPVAVANGGPVLSMSTVPAGGLVLSPANANNLIAALDWEHSENGVPSQANYTVEIAKSGTNFATPIAAGTTNSKFLSWTHEQLNGFLPEPTFTPYTATNIDIRVKSSLGNGANALIQYSNVITVNVTPYTNALPKIAVPGNHQGWSPATAPLLAASAYGKTDYEGFVWLDGDYKFLTPKVDGTFDWGTPDFGDDGSFAGTLIETGESNCNVGTAGYYYVKANTGAVTGANPNGLKYSADPASWAITGAATPNGWPDPALDHDMTYNSTTKKWQITIALTAGEFKFRANNGWTLNLGGDNNGDGFMDFGGPNLSIATPGTYTVILDLSNPRAYTYSVN
jgi:hypothetical protein